MIVVSNPVLIVSTALSIAAFASVVRMLTHTDSSSANADTALDHDEITNGYVISSLLS